MNALRNHEQSMGIWINEPMFRDPATMDKAVDTLADSGFGLIRLFLRNSNFSFYSPEFVGLVECAVEKAHQRGVKVVLDCEPHALACAEMGRKYPDAMGCKLVRGVSKVCDGHWLLRIDAPRGDGAVLCFDGIEAAFLRVHGVVRKVDLDFKMRLEPHHYPNGGIHREENYREGVTVTRSKAIELRGEIQGVTDGVLAAYVRFTSRTLADFWSDGFKRYFDGLLECYRHIPLDGVGWDEPAVDGDWNSYRYGAAFAGAFERLNGYKLSDRLNLLDRAGMSGETAKVRLDYYRTLNEGVTRAQAHLNDTARKLFGDNLIFGTHHTWVGEGGIDDYRAGAVDYFRLNDNMDAGYTDCSWWDPASVAYAYTLASSLGRLTPSGAAEVNTWHYRPTVANTRRNVNLMTLMNIDWFNIWFGVDCDTCKQDGHYTWPHTVKAMQGHRQTLLALGQAKPVADVAIWHGWEGVCGWNRPGLANAQKAFCLNTSKLLIERSIAMDFVDSRLLAESRIENGRLVNRLGSYKVLVVPYGLVMPRKAFDISVAFAHAGGRLVFVGTPVACDEDGQSLTAEFARLCEMPELTAEHYMQGLEVECTLPLYRPQRLEVCRQLSGDLPNKLVSREDEIHGVTAGEGNVVFLTDLDPQQRLLDRIEDVLDKTVTAHGANLLWRLYRDATGERLMVVASDDRPLRGIIFWGRVVIEISGGSTGLLALEASGRPVLIAGDLEIKERHL